MIALACVLVSGVVGWRVWAKATAERVTVTWAGAPACTGTTVDTNHPTPVIEAVGGMRCVIGVVVHNGSGRTVHLENAYADFLGPGSGAVVRAERTDLLAAAPKDAREAWYQLDRDLAPAADYTFDVIVVFRPSGCNDSGTLTAFGWPSLELTALGRDYQIVADRNFRFSREGRTPGCRGM